MGAAPSYGRDINTKERNTKRWKITETNAEEIGRRFDSAVMLERLLRMFSASKTTVYTGELLLTQFMFTGMFFAGVLMESFVFPGTFEMEIHWSFILFRKSGSIFSFFSLY
jgi:hypothetical protein